MAIPPELQDELKSIADLPLAAEVAKAMEGHVNLAAAKAEGKTAGTGNLFNSVIIAADSLVDAERLARVYAKSLSFLGLTEEDKVTRLDWQSVFAGATRSDPHTAMVANLDRAFKDAEGGVLIISEPYKRPEHMDETEFSMNNYSATAELMSKMDETEESFDNAFNDLYSKGDTLGEIEKKMADQSFENPRKPVVIMVGKPFEMNSMIAEDPYPWNMRFIHRLGISDKAAKGITPAAPKPGKPAAP